jgi:hypothetical protein
MKRKFLSYLLTVAMLFSFFVGFSIHASAGISATATFSELTSTASISPVTRSHSTFRA